MKAPLSGDGFSLELFVNLMGVVTKTSQEVFRNQGRLRY
jgi:hypothetical protein